MYGKSPIQIWITPDVDFFSADPIHVRDRIQLLREQSHNGHRKDRMYHSPSKLHGNLYTSLSPDPKEYQYLLTRPILE